MPSASPMENTNMYTFRIHPTNEATNNWVTHAEDDDLVGELEQAIELAKSLNSPITLLDAAGFTKGHVEPNGNYRLS